MNPNYPRDPVFDYRALRLLVGLIALALPFVVSLIAPEPPLPSISASYHTDAQDAFVGMLFIVGAFLWAYNGHSEPQSIASKIAAVSAFLVALYPTACHVCTETCSCATTATTVTHFIAAAVLFSILTYFCLGPFQQGTRGEGGKKGRRSRIYFICGIVMLACMAVIAVANIWLPDDVRDAWRVTYWAEAIALGAFGVAWITAGKYLPPLAEEKERLKLFPKSGAET